MNALPKREHNTVATEVAGIWKSVSKEEAHTQWEAFKGKYRQRYPEAVRSLMEDARTSLELLCVPTSDAPFYS